MARQQLRRYIWLIDTISSANGITYEEINSKWEHSSLNEEGSLLPKRTFFDHLNAIREEIDIEITCDRTDNTYRIDDGFDEYGSIKGTLVNSLILNNAIRENPDMNNRVILSGTFHQDNMPIVLHAIKDSRAIKFRFDDDFSILREEYISKGMSVEEANARYPDVSFVMQFETYGLYFLKFWFAVGRCMEDGKIYIYALHAMNDIEFLDSHYSIPADFDLKRFMAEYKEYFLSPEELTASTATGKLFRDNTLDFECARNFPEII